MSLLLPTAMVYFSKPVLLTQGPHAGKVLKSYKFIKSKNICDELLAIHKEYVPQLEGAGINIPSTEAEVIELNGKYSIRIYQKAFPADTMARKMMQTGNLDECLLVFGGVLSGAITALNYLNQHPNINMGFHPTLRNYAVVCDKFCYFDTFPPMANPTQNELEWYNGITEQALNWLG